MSWLFYAVVSAVAAALTAVLSKMGVEGLSPTLATAIRTVVVAAFSWTIVAMVGDYRPGSPISRRSLIFLVLSGLSTGISWLAYFRALQISSVSRVAPIDKLSLPLTIILAVVWLGEPLGWRSAAGVALMTIGALLTLP